MLVGNSFDLWQKDTFFCAAEEVQESADTMESVYRTWDRERREVLNTQSLDELCRELQTALGTTKWQLEEFERAVRLSYKSRSDDITTARHRQFVAAIEDLISRVEAALREFVNENSKQPLRWVTLDEEDCDDLAAFLSGTPGTSRTSSKASCSSSFSYQTKGFSEIVTSEKDFEHVIKLESKEITRTRDDMSPPVERTTGARRTWSSPDIGSWKIAIPDKDAQKKALLPTLEDTPKVKGSKPVFSKQRCGDRVLANGGMLSCTQLRGFNWINQILGQVGVRQLQLDSSQHLQFSCSIQFTLAIMLSIFIIVPFLIYST